MDFPRSMLFPRKILISKTLLDLKKLDGILKKFKKTGLQGQSKHAQIIRLGKFKKSLAKFYILLIMYPKHHPLTWQ
jgi:hypothetical protein